MHSRHSALARIATPAIPESDRLAGFEPWQTSAACLGLLTLTLPLLLVPGYLADRLAAGDPIRVPVLAGGIGFLLSLATFSLVARALGVSAGEIFLRRPSRSVLWWAAVGLGLGIGVAGGAMALTTGDVSWGPTSATAVTGRLLAGVAIGLWTGTVEELLLRGAVLSLVGHQWHWPGAVILSAALFGLLHNAHAGATSEAVSYVALTATAGVLFALITVATGDVWGAVAVHGTWNALFSPHVLVFGPPAALVPLVRYEIHAGSSFVGAGPTDVPASPVALAMMLLATIAFAAWQLRTPH